MTNQIPIKPEVCQSMKSYVSTYTISCIHYCNCIVCYSSRPFSWNINSTNNIRKMSHSYLSDKHYHRKHCDMISFHRRVPFFHAFLIALVLVLGNCGLKVSAYFSKFMGAKHFFEPTKLGAHQMCSI